MAQPVTLDWNNFANTASYEVQVDNSSTIAAPLVANPTVTVSQATLTCSSGGNKTKTCRFTLTGNAAVTANVQ